MTTALSARRPCAERAGGRLEARRSWMKVVVGRRVLAGGESLRRRVPFAVDVSVGVKFVPSAARDECRGRGVAEPDEEHLVVLLHVVGDGLDRECLRRLAGCEG